LDARFNSYSFYNFVSICMWVMSWWLSSSECMQISLIKYTCKRLPWWADGLLFHFFMWVGRLITVPSGDGLENHRLKRWIFTPGARWGQGASYPARLLGFTGCSVPRNSRNQWLNGCNALATNDAIGMGLGCLKCCWAF